MRRLGCVLSLLVAISIALPATAQIIGGGVWGDAKVIGGGGGTPPTLNAFVGSQYGNSITLTGVLAGDIIVAQMAGSSGASPPTASGLTFANRPGSPFNVSGTYAYSWWAIAASSGSVTISFPQSAPIVAFSVSGANNVSPFDPDGSLPAATGTGTAPVFSTTNPNTFAFCTYYLENNTDTGPGSGWSLIQNGFYITSEYKTFTSPQTSISPVPFVGGNTGNAICDAITN